MNIGGLSGSTPLTGLAAIGTAIGLYLGILVFLLIFAISTAVVAGKKGRSAFGWFFIGLFTGLFGLAVALAILPRKYYIQGGEDDF